MTQKYIRLTNLIKNILGTDNVTQSTYKFNDVKFIVGRDVRNDPTDETRRIITYTIYCSNSKDRFSYNRYGLKDFRENETLSTCEIDFFIGLLKL